MDWIAQPRATHTEAADESDPAVDRKHLAVIATQPAQRAVEIGGLST